MRTEKIPRRSHRNAYIGAKGYGHRLIRVTKVGFGINIQANEAETKYGGAFYPRRVDSSSFSLDVVFVSHRDRQKFNDWLQRYGYAISSPKNTFGPMRVIIPSRHFDRTAIPRSGIAYGETVGDIIFPETIPFRGARTPLEMNSPLISRFKLNKKVIKRYPEVEFFYPASTQLKGSQSGDTLFNPDSASTWPAPDPGLPPSGPHVPTEV